MIVFTEKTAGPTARAIGTILSTMVRHPVTTLGIGAAIAASPWVLDKAFKLYMMHGQGKENKLTTQNQEILKQIAGNTQKPAETKQKQFTVSKLS